MALFSFFKNLFKKKNQELPVTIDLDVVKKTEVTEDVSLFVPTSFPKREVNPEFYGVVEPIEKKEPIKIEKKKKAQPKPAKEASVKATKATKRAPKKEKK